VKTKLLGTDDKLENFFSLPAFSGVAEKGGGEEIDLIALEGERDRDGAAADV
jgi:hypothetical protein